MPDYAVTKARGAHAATNMVYVAMDDPLAAAGKPVHVKVTGDDEDGEEIEFVFLLAGSPSVKQRSALALNTVQRKMLRVKVDDALFVEAYAPAAGMDAGLITCALDFVTDNDREVELDAAATARKAREVLCGQVVRRDQAILLEMDGVRLEMEVRTMVVGEDARQGDEAVVVEKSAFVFESSDSQLRIVGQCQPTKLFKDKDFSQIEKMGVGGLDAQFGEIFRRAFASRTYPQEYIRQLGIKHVKGMLLFGPPGTGKTLLARQIGKMLNAREPKIVNGPEVLNMWVGNSEKNVRELFEDAEKEQKEKGDQSQLHIIIFDEIDAICKKRSSNGLDGGVRDSVVNQLLSKIDGINSVNNLLLIGMTNRRQLLDDALLRPGRLEVQVEIGLPDEAGRLQILRIHTATMAASGLVAGDVELPFLAGRTGNYTGAELAGVVRSAASRAMARNGGLLEDGACFDIKDPALKVTAQDFQAALDEVRPAFGAHQEELAAFYQRGMIDYGPRYDLVRGRVQRILDFVLRSDKYDTCSCLLLGARGVGKTALAVHVGVHSEIPCIKIVRPGSMAGMADHAKCDQVVKAFEDASRSPASVVVLDDIEGLIGYVDVGPRFANDVLQTIIAKVRDGVPAGHKLVVLGTMRSEELARELGLLDAFVSSIVVPSLEKEEARTVLVDLGAFPEDALDGALECLPAETVPVAWLVDRVNMARFKSGPDAIARDVWIEECMS